MKGANHVPKGISDQDSDPFLILPFVNAKLFQIRLLKHTKMAFGIVIRLESLMLTTCERKALSERDLCVCILEMRAEAMHGSKDQSAQ